MLSKKRRRLSPEWLVDMTRDVSIAAVAPHDAATPARRERARQLRLALCKPDMVLENGNLNPECDDPKVCVVVLALTPDGQNLKPYAGWKADAAMVSAEWQRNKSIADRVREETGVERWKGNVLVVDDEGVIAAALAESEAREPRAASL